METLVDMAVDTDVGTAAAVVMVVMVATGKEDIMDNSVTDESR
jgi:hypothetical protein